MEVCVIFPLFSKLLTIWRHYLKAETKTHRRTIHSQPALDIFHLHVPKDHFSTVSPSLLQVVAFENVYVPRVSPFDLHAQPITAPLGYS
jgi:hypothetical protein